MAWNILIVWWFGFVMVDTGNLPGQGYSNFDYETLNPDFLNATQSVEVYFANTQQQPKNSSDIK